ncbi:peptide-methionine (R)-S-oxide reductase MsrB [soil metagenome]
MRLLPLAPLVLLAGCASAPFIAMSDQEKPPAGIMATRPVRKDYVKLSDAEWKEKLTPSQYNILRKEGTEAPYSGSLLNVHKQGVFMCAGCGLPLFLTNAKFDSGTGWPSFFQPASKDAIYVHKDVSAGMARWEVRCARCDGHLGHVFDDGPADKTGLRYCMNSDALTFAPKK